jgi:hypothetical protein
LRTSQAERIDHTGSARRDRGPTAVASASYSRRYCDERRGVREPARAQDSARSGDHGSPVRRPFAAAVTLEGIAAPGNPTSERDGFSRVDPALILVASHLVAAGIFFLCAFDTSYFFGYVFAAKAAGAFMAVFMHNAVSTLAAG